MFTLDLTIGIGTILQTVVLAIGGLVAFVTVQVTVRMLTADIKAVQEDLKRLTEVLIGMADIRGELRALDKRMTGMEADIRELRHGDGIIIPRHDRDLDRG